MLHCSRNNQKLAFVQIDGAIAKLHPETAAQNQKELVLSGVVVPDELTLKFCKLYVLAVQFADYARVPVVRKQRQFLA